MSTNFKSREVTFRKLNQVLTNLHVDFFLLSQEDRNKGAKIQASFSDDGVTKASKFVSDEFELYIAVREKEVCHV